MKRFVSICCAIFLLVAYECGAQNADNWDAALDRYELICERCLELQRQQAEGQDIPKESISSLMVQLSMLRQSLNEARASMTAAQKARFEMIRRRMGVKGSESRRKPSGPSNRNASVATPTETKTPAATTAPAPATGTKTPATTTVPAPASAMEPATTAVERPAMQEAGKLPTVSPASGFSAYASSAGPAFRTPDIVKAPAAIRTEYMIALQAGAARTPSYGIFCGMCRGRWGGYLRARSDFHFPIDEPGLSCNSSGDIEGGGTIWSNGKPAYGRYALSAGMILRAGRRWDVCCGAGYGSFRATVHDIDGNGYLVSDLSARGLSLNIGCLAHFGKRMFAGAGIDCCAFRQADVEFTIGIFL